MKTLLWLQTGACSGDTLSILSAERPSLEDLLSGHGIDLLWQPSLSDKPVSVLAHCIEAIEGGKQVLDILCVEGSILTGPNGSGLYDPFRGRAKMRIVESLAQHAGVVVAMGTCASFGGVHAAPPNPTDAIGLQFDHERPGGLLPPQWRSRLGLPVINIAGCPAHPNTMVRTLAMLAAGETLKLDHLNRPAAFFGALVHAGCTRNEHHEYDVEDTEPGGEGCMFYNLGCQGPTTAAPCNTDLWNGQSSKTRAGVPCFGCTAPDFPREGNLFATEKIGRIPVRLPLGVERARYMAYKSLAQAAAPARLKRGSDGAPDGE